MQQVSRKLASIIDQSLLPCEEALGLLDMSLHRSYGVEGHDPERTTFDSPAWADWSTSFIVFAIRNRFVFFFFRRYHLLLAAKPRVVLLLLLLSWDSSRLGHSEFSCLFPCGNDSWSNSSSGKTSEIRKGTLNESLPPCTTVRNDAQFLRLLFVVRLLSPSLSV